MTIAIIIASALTYLTGWEYTAKAWYRHIRPFSEPLSCGYRGSIYSYHEHSKYCYQREHSLVSTKREAAGWAALTGLAWPAIVAFMLITSHIIRGDRPHREELEAKIARLERELDES